MALFDGKRSLIDLPSEPVQQVENPISSEPTSLDHQEEPRGNPRASSGISELGNSDEIQRKADRESEERFRSRSLLVQWCLFGATMLAFGAAAYYAYIADGQRLIMNGQFMAMIGQLQTMKDSVEAVRLQTPELIRSADAAKEGAQAGTKQANISDRTAKAAEIALRTTEVADLQPNRVNCSTAPKELGLETELSFSYFNRGRTSAVNVRTAFYAGRYGVPISPIDVVSGGSTVGAGQEITSTPIAVKNTISPIELQRINNRELLYHIWGWTAYEDRFGGHHLTVFDNSYIPHTPCSFLIVRVVSK